MKILNLYAGIGGNRKLWDSLGDFEITAVEYLPAIAKVYAEHFPKDKIIIADAHQYLLEHFAEFDFIWSSPPCPSHSAFRKGFSIANGAKPIFPDMKLYEEILFLQHYFKGKWVVENVRPFYEPLIRPQIIQRHCFWTNFYIADINLPADVLNIVGNKKAGDENEKLQIKRLEEKFGISIKNYKGKTARKTLLRNCVEPQLGLHILKESMKEPSKLF